MNILMIVYNDIGKGTFLRAFYFAQELVKLNQNVTILAASKKGFQKYIEKGVNIIGIPSIFSKGPRYGWDPYSIFARIRWVKKSNQFDIIHCFETRPTVIYPALYLKRRRNIPLIFDWCDWFGKGGSIEERPNSLAKILFRPLETYFENSFRSEPDHTTVICKSLQQRAIDLGVPREKLSIILNGFNMPNWLKPCPASARLMFGFKPNEFVIGYVGSMFPSDAILMENAFDQISRKLTAVRLLLIGRSNYFPKHNNQLIIKIGHVNTEQLQIGLAASDLCWLPFSDIAANWGRFPLKFSDYLSSGKPIFGTNVGDIPDFIRKYTIGEVCKPTASDLANTIIHASKYPITLKNYAENAYRLSQDSNFSWENRAREIYELYLKVVKYK